MTRHNCSFQLNTRSPQTKFTTFCNSESMLFQIWIHKMVQVILIMLILEIFQFLWNLVYSGLVRGGVSRISLSINWLNVQPLWSWLGLENLLAADRLITKCTRVITYNYTLVGDSMTHQITKCTCLFQKTNQPFCANL